MALLIASKISFLPAVKISGNSNDGLKTKKNNVIEDEEEDQPLSALFPPSMPDACFSDAVLPPPPPVSSNIPTTETLTTPTDDAADQHSPLCDTIESEFGAFLLDVVDWL